MRCDSSLRLYSTAPPATHRRPLDQHFCGFDERLLPIDERMQPKPAHAPCPSHQ